MSRLSETALALLLLVGGAGAVGLVWHALQAAEHARVRGEAQAQLAAVRQERIAALERELTSALVANDGVRTFVRERLAAESVERQAREERLRATTKPMPDGLRLAIDTLHDLLRRSGHRRLRVLSVRAIEDKALRDLELFEAPEGTAGATVWQAGRTEVRLDRGTGALTMRLCDGHVVRGGQRSALPEAGELLVLHGVDGPAFEDRLPFLVIAEGDYPQPTPRVPAPAKLDPFTAQSWCARLNDVLAAAKTVTRWRVTEIQGLADAEFLGVVLLGASGKRVEQMAEVDRLAIVVDDAAGTVEMEMIGGVLHRTGGDTTLPASAPGQRILLPGVSPQAAAHGLTGMVVQR